ncbi:MAG: hypothetical protein P1U58_20365 [Verrucomicrobiales bacterium]|nr:hypothetical protein [Verrucomicrobiales bacterium]
MRFPLPNLLSVFAAALTSCASSQLHYIDEGAAAALKQEQTVIVMGLMSEKSQLMPRAGERSRILNDLETRLKQKRKKLTVASHGTFERKAGRVRTSGSGNRGSVSYALNSSQLEKVRSIGADFGVIVVLRANGTWCSVDESTSTEEHHEYDKEGNIVSCHLETTYTTSSFSSRKAKADYLLYDLNTGSKIWECSSDYSESNSRSNSCTRGYPPPPSHPEPPCLHDVMKNMAAAAVRKFPK